MTGGSAYRRLLQYLKPHLAIFAVSVVGFIIFAISQPALAKVTEILVDAIEAKDSDARYYIPALIAVIYVVRGFGAFLGGYYMSMVGNKIVMQLRQDVFNSVTYLPTAFYDENNSGKLINRILANTQRVTGAATDAVVRLVREGFTVIGLLAYAFYMNWQLSISFLVIAPVLGGLVYVVGRRLRKLSTKAQNSMGDITQVCTESINNQRVVKSFQGEQTQTERFAHATERNFRQSMNIVKIASLSTPVMQFVVVAALGLIVFMVLAPGYMSEMSTGQYVAYITTIGLLPKPIRQLSGVNAIIQKGVAASIDVFELIDTPPEKNTGTKIAENIRGNITVRDLNFSYAGTDDYALKELNFDIAAGQTVALVGRSGSGKSTFAALLNRFYDYSEGRIEVDGVDIRDYELFSFRQNIGIVTQHVNLFNDTIAANIAYGTPNATIEQIRAAADDAFATQFIESFPEGFDTQIGENGVKLSGGQKQRLAIARTLLKNTPILLLDEATSALDNESERFIQIALDRFMENRSTLVIAHRLSTVINADLILVMDKGQVIEQGTHAELLAQNGYYTKLYEQDFE